MSHCPRQDRPRQLSRCGSCSAPLAATFAPVSDAVASASLTIRGSPRSVPSSVGPAAGLLIRGGFGVSFSSCGPGGSRSERLVCRPDRDGRARPPYCVPSRAASAPPSSCAMGSGMRRHAPARPTGLHFGTVFPTCGQGRAGQAPISTARPPPTRWRCSLCRVASRDARMTAGPSLRQRTAGGGDKTNTACGIETFDV